MISEGHRQNKHRVSHAEIKTLFEVVETPNNFRRVGTTTGADYGDGGVNIIRHDAKQKRQRKLVQRMIKNKTEADATVPTPHIYSHACACSRG